MKRKKSLNFIQNLLMNLIKIILIIFLVLMILLIWTDDLYDYTNWDIALGLQLFGFVGLMAGFVLFFFKPFVSAWVIIFSSIYFWLITALFKGLLWLGPLFFFFPLIGLLILVISKLNNYFPTRPKKS